MKEAIKSIESQTAIMLSALGLGAVALTGCAPQLDYKKPAVIVRHIDNPVLIYNQDQEYELDVSQCGVRQEKGTGQQDCVEGSIYVDEETYSRYKDGQTIKLPEEP